jgi:hypothetical protein
MSNIQYLKLSNGAELIGYVIYENEEYVSVKDALSVDQVQTQDGKETIALFPYTAFNKFDQTNVNASHVITKYHINSTLQEYYELSLSFAKIHQQRIDKQIGEVNGEMRDQLFEMANDQLFGQYNSSTSPMGSKAIN